MPAAGLARPPPRLHPSRSAPPRAAASRPPRPPAGTGACPGSPMPPASSSCPDRCPPRAPWASAGRGSAGSHSCSHHCLLLELLNLFEEAREVPHPSHRVRCLFHQLQLFIRIPRLLLQGPQG